MNSSEMEIAFEMMGSKLKGYGDNRSASCPLAPWTHRGGRDKNASLTAKEADPFSLYKCWSCNHQGSVKKLAKLYGDFSGDYRAYEYVSSLEGGKGNFWSALGKRPKSYSSYSHNKRVGKRIEQQVKKITEEEVKEMMKDVPKYAFDRGMTWKEIDQWQIGYDKKEKRMVFPIRDFRKSLCGISGRALSKDQKPKYKHYYGLKKEQVLYGEQFLDLKQKRCYLVEGFFDVIFLTKNGYKNVMAVMGTSLSENHIQKITRWFNEVVLLPDMDHAGIVSFSEMARKLFFAKMKVGIAGIKVDAYDPKLIQFKVSPAFEGDPGDWDKQTVDTALDNIFWVGEK